MRILFLTYDHPFTGHSGVSMYCRDLFPALVERGMTIGGLCVQRRDWRLRPYLRSSHENGVTLYSLVNSPLDPEESLYRPEHDCSQPAIEALVRSCLRHFRPDIVHVQTLQGYPGSIVAVAKELRIPTVVMLHDNWAICPRLALVRSDGTMCDGPDGGRNCVRFCVQRRPWSQKLYRFGSRLPEGWCRRTFLRSKALYHRYIRAQGSPWTAPPPAPVRWDEHLLSRHAARSASFLRALREAEQIFAVSDFVKSVFIRHGIPADRIRTLPTALALNGVLRRLRRAPSPQIRFGFLGRAVPMKGAHILAAACRGLPRDRARVLIFGPASPETRRDMQGLSGDLPLEFHGPYVRAELPKILEQVDVIVVPSLAQETVGLVVVEAQAAGVPIIGSRIGAIPEYVQDGQGGMLFTPGDPEDLRRKMLRIIEDPALVEAMSAGTRPPMAVCDHADILVSLYEGAMEKGRSTTWTLSSA
jgi:glycosyltransferase involved in cell wall biosynthesis